MQISTSLRAQIGEHLRLLDLILRTATAVWLRNNEQNNATTATCEMRFGSFPNYIFKILAVEMTSIMITVRKREEFDECRDAFWLNALIFRSSSWDNSHTCCSQPVSLLAPPYPAYPNTPRSCSALARPWTPPTNWQETTMLRWSDWQQTMKTHSSWDLAERVFTWESIGSDTSSLAGCLRSRFGMPLSLPTLPL